MRASVNITGLQKLRNRIARMANNLRDLKPAYLRSGVVVLTAAQQRINADGPGWLPTIETSRGSALQRTGALLRSLSIDQAEMLPDGIRVGTNLRTPDGKYGIGRLMQEGTGIYGPSGQPITPNKGRFLAFEVNGQMVYARSVKGSPPRPFLFIDDSLANKVLTVFAQHVQGRKNA